MITVIKLYILMCICDRLTPCYSVTFYSVFLNRSNLFLPETFSQYLLRYIAYVLTSVLKKYCETYTAYVGQCIVCIYIYSDVRLIALCLTQESFIFYSSFMLETLVVILVHQLRQRLVQALDGCICCSKHTECPYHLPVFNFMFIITK